MHEAYLLYPESGHFSGRSGCPLRANSGRSVGSDYDPRGGMQKRAQFNADQPSRYEQDLSPTWFPPLS